MVLEAIVARKRHDVAGRKLGLDEVRHGLGPSRRDLEAALRAPRTGFVLECKKASPSRGVLRDDFDVASLSLSLARHADAISVVTEEESFGGRLQLLRVASEATRLPVLCKDFVVDPYQVFEARKYGADAILLMLSVLDDDGWRRCAGAARSLNMDVLTEVHDTAELARAVELGARIIGINNRNLRTLEVDLGTTERLAAEVPADRVILCESGVSSHADVRRLRDRVDGFLVGSAVMCRSDVSMAAREIIFGAVKVCGLTNTGDARAAMNAGATHGGLVFVEPSTRRVDLEQARACKEAVNLRWVGVFVNESVDRVERTVEELDLDVVQLHGDESAEEVAELELRLPPEKEIWKALRVNDSRPRIEGFAADRVLLDAFSPTSAGGGGVPFDWSLLSDLDISEMVLAGGLDPSNVARADTLGAHALDVSSGIESVPGKKSSEKLEAFFSELRGIGRARGRLT